ncbi:MAG TPA: hypothetical protein VHT27_06040, partial [Solirubrobacteraceae bacterium]|nr:hypothetical protein [Solirubrobacteraceae bacterium]
MTDVLPEGVVATDAGELQEGNEETIGEGGLWNCTVGQVVTCVNNPEALPEIPGPPVLSSYALSQSAFEHIGIKVRVSPAAVEGVANSCVGELARCNQVTVAGGGAPSAASTSVPVTIGGAPPSAFGLQGLDGWAGNPDGTVDTQAGSHPYDVSFSFDLNAAINSTHGGTDEPVGGQVRNITVSVPPGLVGDPAAVAQCTRQAFEERACSAETQVGWDVPTLGAETPWPEHPSEAVYNLVPPPGVPAEFGFNLLNALIFLDAGVRSGGDYGITVHADNLPEYKVLGNRITLWGEPSNPSHDDEREAGEHAVDASECRNRFSGKWGCVSGAARVPFLTLPTACEGPSTFLAGADTWETAGLAEGSFVSHDSNDVAAGLSGCGGLGFAPSLSVAPDTSDADTPAGLTVDVRVPQEGLVTPGALATSNIKNTTVMLPPGFVINPGQAAGLQACEAGPVSGADPHRDNLPLPGEDGEEERFDGPADCQNGSKVGTVQIATPLLKEDLEGNVYILRSNPPHLKLLVAASAEGVNLKLVGDVELCEATGEMIGGRTCEAPGQLVATFSKTPELPFTDFKLSFSGGAQAALDTPTRCGTYTTTSDFTPWSTPATPDAFPSSRFQVTLGPGGTACPSGALPFAPVMTAGSTSDQAGAFTGFSMLLQRGDDQQRIESLSFREPRGLAGLISSVPLCGEAQANAGTCPAGSQIGHAVVSSGPGPYPLVLPQPG